MHARERRDQFRAPLIVLDDDPTGTQLVSGIPVVLDWSGSALDEAMRDRPAAVHVETNSRALEGAAARTAIESAAAAAIATGLSPRFLLRGDSTLRGHVLEEYLGLCDVAFDGRTPPLVLAMALPTAGRVTIDGTHLLAGTPVHETEYAHDGHFSYSHSELLRWAEERSAGVFAADRGAVISLAQLRARGAEALLEALRGRTGTASVVVLDAETDDDLELSAAAVQTAWDAGIELVIRGAPAFAASLAGTRSPGLVPPPEPGAGLLVICGSYVPTTTRQLARLEHGHPGALVEADLVALRADRESEIARLAREAGRRLVSGRLAVVSTPRTRPRPGASLADGVEIARSLASVAGLLAHDVGVVLAKGGITSAVVARDGLGSEIADVIGPIAPGVAFWRLRHTSGARSYLVFPGNVGSDEALADVVDLILAA